MNLIFDLVIVLIIALLLVKERSFVVGSVRIVTKDKRTWKK